MAQDSSYEKLSSLTVTINFEDEENARKLETQLKDKPDLKLKESLDKDEVIILLNGKDISTLCYDCIVLISDIHTMLREKVIDCVEWSACELHMPGITPAEAKIIRGTLDVDKSPKNSNTVKTFKSDNGLEIGIGSGDIREMKVAVKSFLDLLRMILSTIDQWGPALPTFKKHCVEA